MKKKTLVSFLFLLIFMSFTVPHKKGLKIFLAGDSTISIKEKKAFPETGWGMPFAHFWDSTITVVNKAKNGRSTRTFISEGLWQSIIDEMEVGDYVLIQFGHNDEAKDKVERYTTPEQYKANLAKFVKEAKAKGGRPILVTPVSRRRFKDGKALETHAEYSLLVKETSQNLKVPLIDLDVKSRNLYQQMGEDDSKYLFLQLNAGEHPNYPEGKNDNTHFSEMGARLIAQIMLAELKALNLDLTDYIVKPVVK